MNAMSEITTPKKSAPITGAEISADKIAPITGADKLVDKIPPDKSDEQIAALTAVCLILGLSPRYGDSSDEIRPFIGSDAPSIGRIIHESSILLCGMYSQIRLRLVANKKTGSRIKIETLQVLASRENLDNYLSSLDANYSESSVSLSGVKITLPPDQAKKIERLLPSFQLAKALAAKAKADEKAANEAATEADRLKQLADEQIAISLREKKLAVLRESTEYKKYSHLLTIIAEQREELNKDEETAKAAMQAMEAEFLA